MVSRARSTGSNGRSSRAGGPTFGFGSWIGRSHSPSVDGEVAAPRPLRRDRVLPRHDERGIIVGHDEARARRELRDHAARLRRAPRQEERVRDPAPRKARRRVARPLEDEAMDPVARERIVRPERLVDEARDAELVRPFDRERQRRVVLGAPVHLRPVHDELAIGRDRAIVQPDDPRVVRSKAERRRLVPCCFASPRACHDAAPRATRHERGAGSPDGARGFSRYAIGTDAK
jgi:hypothetical protein